MDSIQDCREKFAKSLPAMLATASDTGLSWIRKIRDAGGDRELHPADEHRARRAMAEEGRRVLDRSRNEGRNPSEQETAAFDGFLAAADMLRIKGELRELTEKTFGSTGSSTWHTEDGTRVRAVASGESVADSAAFENRYNVGDIMAAMAGRRSGPDVRAALSEGTDSAGGYTVPDILVPQFIDAMRNRTSVIRAGAKTVLLESDVTKMASIATDPTVAWRAENASVSEGDPTFGAVTFTPRSLAVVIKVSQELLADSVNIGDMLQTALAGAFAVELDRVALFGSGSAPEPRGIYTTTNVNSVSMGTNGAALTNYDPFIDAVQAIYEDNGPAPTAAIMAPRTWAALAKLKAATTNEPLPRPPAIEGLTFYQTQQVPINQTQGSASNASAIVLGDFSNLAIGVRQSLRINILRETYAGNLQIGFLAHMRLDVQALQAKAFAKIIGIIP